MMLRAFSILFAACVLASCSGRDGDGIVDVAIVGSSEELFTDGVRLATAGQYLRAATRQGLVRRDERGQVVPGIAARWIVTDAGKSYIFRLREIDLPNGERLTAQMVRDSLLRTMARLKTTSMGYDLAEVRDIRALTARVIEVRLKSPMPTFLQLLAQPEMGVPVPGPAPGPMKLTRKKNVAVLDTLPPETRGLPSEEGWEEGLLQVRVVATGAKAATDGFANGRYELVLNGRIESLPFADTGALSRGTIRLDSTIGLFGLNVKHTKGFLANSANREALSMAIDRAELIQPFNIAGWTPTTRLVSPGLPGDTGAVGERWTGMSIEERRARAAARVRSWKAASGGKLTLTIGLPAGPGSDRLFAGLESSFSAIGIEAIQLEMGEGADLELRDRVARFAGPRWFLNQFNCTISRATCSKGADYLVSLAVEARDPAEKASYLAEAEAALTKTNLFIPFGPPIRWSLARADIEGFVENSWGFHPLFALTGAPN